MVGFIDVASYGSNSSIFWLTNKFLYLTHLRTPLHALARGDRAATDKGHRAAGHLARAAPAGLQGGRAAKRADPPGQGAGGGGAPARVRYERKAPVRVHCRGVCRGQGGDCGGGAVKRLSVRIPQAVRTPVAAPLLAQAQSRHHNQTQLACPRYTLVSSLIIHVKQIIHEARAETISIKSWGNPLSVASSFQLPLPAWLQLPGWAEPHRPAPGPAWQRAVAATGDAAPRRILSQLESQFASIAGQHAGPCPVLSRPAIAF